MLLVYTKSAVFTTTSTFKTADNTILVMYEYELIRVKYKLRKTPVGLVS